MGQNRNLQLRTDSFSGHRKVYSSSSDGLSAHIRNLLAIEGSRTAIAGATVDFSVADSSTAVGKTLVVGDATGGTVEDQFTLLGGVLGVPTGHPVVFRGADLPSGITAGTTYYIIRKMISGSLSKTIFQVAASELNARSGVPVEMADDGSGSQWIQRQIALPDQPTLHDSLSATTGILDTDVKVVVDKLMETLASVVNVLAPMQVDLGMPAVDIGTLTGAVTTVVAMEVACDANTDDDDAADYSAMVTIYDTINSAIKTVVHHVNDLAAAVGQDEFLGLLTPQFGTEAEDPTTAGIDAITAPTSAVGGAEATVAKTEFDAALVDWVAAIGHITQRVSVVSAAAQSVDNWTAQLVPSATEVSQVKLGLRTRATG